MLSALESAGISPEEAQALIASPDNVLARQLLEHLRRHLPAGDPVPSRPTFRTPQDVYERFEARAKARNWEFTQSQMNQLHARLPVGFESLATRMFDLDIWLGNLKLTLSELKEWVVDEQLAAGNRFVFRPVLPRARNSEPVQPQTLSRVVLRKHDGYQYGGQLW